MRFVIIFAPGPAWIEGKPVFDQQIQEHVDYMEKLFREGMLIMGGPFADNAGGLAIIEASGEPQARELLERDPAVIDGLLKGEVHPWQVVFG